MKLRACVWNLLSYCVLDKYYIFLEKNTEDIKKSLIVSSAYKAQSCECQWLDI